jgi:hypothetical protein
MEPVERALSCAKDYVQGQATRFATTITGRPADDLRRPPITMFSLGASEVPLKAALHLPTFPFGGHDGSMAYRVATWLEEQGLDAEPYARAVESLAGTSLDRSIGVHNYVSVQGAGPEMQVTAYLCPRFYQSRLGPIAYDPATTWPTPVQLPKFQDWWTSVQRAVFAS